MTEQLSKREQLRHAVADYLDFPINEPAFEACDRIADAILEDGLTEAWEIAEGAVETYNGPLVEQWFGLNARGAAAEQGFTTGNTDALELIRLDVYVVLELAASCALNVAESFETDGEE
jgi:hypothetical protein